MCNDIILNTKWQFYVQVDILFETAILHSKPYIFIRIIPNRMQNTFKFVSEIALKLFNICIKSKLNDVTSFNLKSARSIFWMIFCLLICQSFWYMYFSLCKAVSSDLYSWKKYKIKIKDLFLKIFFVKKYI